ncbi:NitT/TauT family transport system substrate-binding protein [Clostridium punense]|uniref:NitT/TauT family transport system substrate-binding protein n=1 Tax=Clostridium punense TaxID=1054297 RepID=A0ABS4KCT0_9CLOT|nr:MULTISPECIES: ABC transporter substrate-binding protein [Clostridium]EQB88656.1 hypothetical protein M918_23755 [Clostridium sp. BL8]MBP2024409.1 NitT/TauT family transport system substrate-binding protein [Clostridium punense]
MKKLVSILASITIIASTLGLAGCSSKPKEVQPIRFGLLPAESAIPFIVAKEQGFFEKEGLKVELTMFNSPNDRNVAVQGKQLDGTIADVMTGLSLNDGGFKMKITSDINEDFKLLTSPNSGIDSFQKLDKKDVSLVPNFVLEYIMDKMAEKNNITYSVVNIPSIPARFEALLADKISGVMFTEPQATQLKEKGAKVLASSKEYNIKAGSVLFDENTINNNADGIKAFYRAYNKAVDLINTESVEKYGNYLNKYTFSDTIKDYLNSGAKYEKAAQIPKETFEDVLKWTKTKNTVKNDYKYEDVSNFNFIK